MMTGTKLQRAPTTYSPFGSTFSREVGEMRDRMRRLMQEPFGRLFPDVLASETTVGWFPAVEISENDAEYMLVAELPGMKAKDVELDFTDGVLTIRGEKQEEREEKDEKRRYHLWERGFGTFLRTFEFPNAIADDQIRAEHKDGLLEVHLPKRPNAKGNGRKIQITDKAADNVKTSNG